MVKKRRACIFISGTGTNLRSIIKNSRDYNFCINHIKTLLNQNPKLINNKTINSHSQAVNYCSGGNYLEFD